MRELRGHSIENLSFNSLPAQVSLMQVWKDLFHSQRRQFMMLSQVHLHDCKIARDWCECCRLRAPYLRMSTPEIKPAFDLSNFPNVYAISMSPFLSRRKR